jgi:thiol-disulfide isomerase/thioredoxin
METIKGSSRGERGRMKARLAGLVAMVFAGLTSVSQTGYEIRVNLKGCEDSVAYLVKYIFDQTYMVDTCKRVKKGAMTFKGRQPLDKGVYILVSQEKAPFFEFLVNESQKFVINADISDIAGSLEAPGNKENSDFFSYLRYTSGKNQEFNAARQETAGKSREDSTKIMQEKVRQLEADIKRFDEEFMVQIRGTFLYDFMNLKAEKNAPELPLASNGRPDSIYQYYYYKNHYFDGVDLRDERIARTPYFDDRVKRFFEQVLINNPDTVISEIDKLLARTQEGNLNFNVLIGYLTYKYEQSKIVGFDKVFLHLVDKYIVTGKAKGIYSEETIKNLKERSVIMNPLLEGKKIPDLYVIDTLHAREVRAMGFDTARSAKSVTALYYKNQTRLAPMLRTLYQVDAKYTVLLFWASDCGHCQKEVPKLHESMKSLAGKMDVRVFAVQTKDDHFEEWRRFLITHKITDFINVYDPVHLNNFKEKFDMSSTPLIYILDRDKKIIAKKMASENVVEILKAYDKQAKP